MRQWLVGLGPWGRYGLFAVVVLVIGSALPSSIRIPDPGGAAVATSTTMPPPRAASFDFTADALFERWEQLFPEGPWEEVAESTAVTRRMQLYEEGPALTVEVAAESLLVTNVEAIVLLDDQQGVDEALVIGEVLLVAMAGGSLEDVGQSGFLDLIDELPEGPGSVNRRLDSGNVTVRITGDPFLILEVEP